MQSLSSLEALGGDSAHSHGRRSPRECGGAANFTIRQPISAMQEQARRPELPLKGPRHGTG